MHGIFEALGERGFEAMSEGLSLKEADALRQFISLGEAYRGLLAALEAEVAAVGLTPARLRVLLTLLHERPEGASGMSAGALSSRSQVTTPTMTRLLDGLHLGGFITRLPDPDDRRALIITPTALGRDAAQAVVSSFASQMARALGGFGHQDRALLTILLARLSEAASASR